MSGTRGQRSSRPAGSRSELRVTTMRGRAADHDGSPPEPGATLWHYILTLGTEGDLSSIDGRAWLSPTAVRSRVLADLRAEVRERGGKDGSGPVLQP